MAIGRVNVGGKTIEEYGLFEINPNIKRELIKTESIPKLTGMTGLSAINIRNVGRQRNYWVIQPSVAGVFNWQVIKYNTNTKTLRHDGEIPGTKHISSKFHYPRLAEYDPDFFYIKPEGVGFNVKTKRRYYLTKNKEREEILEHIDYEDLGEDEIYVNETITKKTKYPYGFYKEGKKIADLWKYNVSSGTESYGENYGVAELFIRDSYDFIGFIDFNTGKQYLLPTVSGDFFGTNSYTYFDNDDSIVIYPNEKQNQFEIYKYYRAPIE